ncbi:MAG: hypothetical protein FWC73_08230 [Defluviitaleaceae bacterium]|nr:hypothetical protein [Defluviitaleaceae bacterium]
MSYTLKEVFTPESCPDWRTFWYVLSNFLDDFKRSSSCDRLTDEPNPIEEKINSFLAATAEQLAKNYQLQIPLWVYRKIYALKEPFFPSKLKGDYRFFALKESPLAFSARNIFVTSNVLDRY